ncbi:shikimate kinase [Arcticibacterium luteifluviistationis]|uniref:Shikimate kinase n=1 Tax=Arcticibacterium luteifluviistationis TaxID=1784714 RepID=A0A2Z4GA51_9BACT|nr:shikimate kinase [Arcticibacterium luteifluviistationis]AWV98091.1 shikimate kinase [Arcticibacterium luteifluviistationis]
MTTNIFMLGMPSSGKSTLGRNLAKELNYDFIDLDRKIEVSEGKKIDEIFRLEGEEYFRKKESEQLKKIPVDDKLVIALGGGTPCYFDNMDYIKENGVSIFLDVSPDKLEERMRTSRRNNRPMFKLENENLLETLTDTYNKRIDLFRTASIIIEGDTDASTILWILEAQFPKLANR